MINNQLSIIKNQKGLLSLTVLIFGTLAIIILSGLVIWADAGLKTSYRLTDRALAFRIAEAGIEYYRWHLAQNPNDFQDGTGQPGPYVHNFYDRNGVLLGTFSLEITSPPLGSSVAVIKSTGKVQIDPNIEKIIEARMAKPSFASYAAIVNADVKFDEGTEVFGPVHSNGGIHFDGLAHNVVTSALGQYKDPDHSGNDEFGVHTHRSPVDPMPPNPVPLRPDVFEAGREFPVPVINFAEISDDLASIKSAAQASGRYFGPSGEEGYHLVFKTNDTFELYKVTEVEDLPNGCIEVLGQKDFDSWSIETEQFLSNYTIPADGNIFFEDHVWVDGKINTARVVVGAGVFPENSSKYAHIIVNKDLLYTNYDGQDAIGLVAQGNLSVGWISEDDLRIDGALFAQNWRVGRFYYRPPSGNQNRCGPHHIKSTFTAYGMIASNQRYGFSYDDGTGYQTSNLIYDANLLYAPPPSFPLTEGSYEQISWTEEK